MNYSVFKKLFIAICYLVISIGFSANAQPGIGIPFGCTETSLITLPTFSTVTTVPSASQDNTTFIFSPFAFNYSFAGKSYNNFLVSTNGWVALLPASDIPASSFSKTATSSLVIGTIQISFSNTTGITAGMWVSAGAIFGGRGYAQVKTVTATTITLNTGVTSNATVGMVFNFFTLSLPYFDSALPTNSISTYTGARPLIAPLWDDLSTINVSYGFSGFDYFIRWQCRWDRLATSSTYAFVAGFNSSTGNITFSYPTTAYTPSLGASASIGIAGIVPGDYYSVNPLSATTLSLDSTLETSNIKTVRPVNTTIVWNPFSPNDNCSGSHLPINLGTITPNFATAYYSTVNATTSGTNICATVDNKDVWFKITKPAGSRSFKITTTPASSESAAGTTVQVYETCGGPSLGCSSTGTTYPTFGEVSIARPTCNSEEMLVRVTSDGNVVGKFGITASLESAFEDGKTCSTSFVICSLPYSVTGGSTLGTINNYDSTNSICHSPYSKGEDVIYSYTPVNNECVSITVSNTNSPAGVFVSYTCPNDLNTNFCLTSAEGTGTLMINSVTLQAGNTYYIMIDNAIPNGSTTYDLSITSLSTTPAYDDCSTAFNLGTVSRSTTCVSQTLSTSCANSTPYTHITGPSCILVANPPIFNFITTGDIWAKFTPDFSGAVQIQVSNSAQNASGNVAMNVYTGICGSMINSGEYACDLSSGPGNLPYLEINVDQGTTYYIRMWTEMPFVEGNLDICVKSACAPENDSPCNATLLTLDSTYTYQITDCASSANEPINAAQCVSGGSINTLWYKVVVPASGSLLIRTNPGTLADQQIQAYTYGGNCSNLAGYVSKGCNDNGTSPWGGFIESSELALDSLTPNDTILIAVDGKDTTTGSFEILIIDPTTQIFPPMYRRDCANPQVLCTTSPIIIPNPGDRGYGNVVDLPLSPGCWGVGERNSSWFKFTIDPSLSNDSASLALDIISSATTDMDFIIWDVTGLSNECVEIQSQTFSFAACSYRATQDSTGLSFDPNHSVNYDNGIGFRGNARTYLMLLNNWNNSVNGGYNLTLHTNNLVGASVWTGGTQVQDTLFGSPDGWGNCSLVPDCSVNALVNSTSNGRQPTITSNQSVRDLTINTGATLRIKAGVKLTICGNLINDGTLICEPGSTIEFINSATQSVSGNFVNANAFSSLSINKTGGEVFLSTTADINENLILNSDSSALNVNGKTIKIGGDFMNYKGNQTFKNYVAGTLEFNGTNNQIISNQNDSMHLNNLIVNKNSGKIILQGINCSLFIDSSLALNNGVISTRSDSALQISLLNEAPASLSGGSAASFVDGKLCRKLISSTDPLSFPATFDFPVGDSLNPGGYNMIRFTFTTPTDIPDLQVSFSSWNSTSLANGPSANECNGSSYDLQPLLNNGYWTAKNNSSAKYGNFDVSLFNTGYNNLSGNSYTVAKADLNANLFSGASWSLLGQCSPLSTAGESKRSGLNNPADASTAFNFILASAQGDTHPLQISAVQTTPVTCYGGMASVTISGSGGLPPYSGVGTFQTTAGTITYTITDSEGATASTTISILQPTQVIASATMTSAILCFGQSGLVSITASGGEAPYSGIGTYSQIAGTTTYTIQDNNGCVASTSILLSEPSELIASATAGTIQCFGGTTTTQVSAVGGTTPYSGIGGFSQIAGTQNYVVTDANGCSASTTIAISQPSKVESVISSSPSICFNPNGSASVIANGGVGNYSFLWSNGETTSAISGLNAGSYSVVVSDANNCTSSASVSVLNGGSSPSAPGAITGPSSLCRNSSGIVFSVNPVANADSYIWTLPNGITGISTSNSITVNVGAIYNGGFICVAAINNCGTGSSACMNVSVITTAPTQPVFTSSSSIICGNANYTFSVSSVNATNYTWSVTGTGVSIVSGQGTNTIQLNVLAGFGQGSVQVFASNCFGNSLSRGMTITGVPTHGNTVTGPSYVCPNNTAVYSMPLVTGVTSGNYVWSATGDATIINTNVNANSANATVLFGPNWTSGQISISTSTICGTFSRTFTVRSVPVQPGSISGPNTNLCNQSNVTYSIAPVATATSYSWSVPPGVSLVSVAPNGLSIVVNFTSAFTSNSADICVYATNSCGNGPARCYTVTSRTPAPTISGPTTVCKSQSSVAYNASSSVSVNSYLWSITNGASISTTSNPAIANFTTTNSPSSLIRVIAFNNCGPSPTAGQTVAVNSFCRLAEDRIEGITFYPNPVAGKGSLEMVCEEDQKYNLCIRDILGRTLFCEDGKLLSGNNVKEIDFSNFEKGIYQLTINGEDFGSTTIKIVVE